MADTALASLPGWGARTDAQFALDWARAWYGPVAATGGLVVIWRKGQRAMFITVGTFLQAIEANGLDELVWPRTGGYCDVYVGAALVRDRLVGFSRGGKANVAWSPGFWIDFDIKTGSFTSTDEILRLLERLAALGVGADLLVGSGSGGVHGYWRVAGGCAPSVAEELSKRMRLLVQELTGRQVDSCENFDRVLRLPGTVRFPKPDEDKSVQAAPVTLLQVGGTWTDPAAVRSRTEALWTTETARLSSIRRDADLTIRQARSAYAELAGPVAEASSMSALYERYVTAAEAFDALDWADLLVPLGWVVTDVEDDGSRIWRWPGASSDRSAKTDWPPSPNVMSLLSHNPALGLLGDWREAGVPITKLRLAAWGWCDGDVTAALKRLVLLRREGKDWS